jgi:hypothetical protein
MGLKNPLKASYCHPSVTSYHRTLSKVRDRIGEAGNSEYLLYGKVPPKGNIKPFGVFTGSSLGNPFSSFTPDGLGSGWEVLCERWIPYSSNLSKSANSVKLIFGLSKCRIHIAKVWRDPIYWGVLWSL